MKVLAVMTYKKYVVVEVPDVVEPEIDQSRKPDWNARHNVIQVAGEKSNGVPYEWVYSDFYQEDKTGNDGGDEVDGVKFESVEWFDT